MYVPKAKDEYFICSIYSYDIGDYPFTPFIAKNVPNAICRYLVMAINQGAKFCPNPELHIIGTAIVKKGRILEIKPSDYIYRIDTENHLAKRLYYTIQLQKKVKLTIDRLITYIYSFQDIFKKNLKEPIIVEREN